ncbi:MAG TPA: hypothetical protein DEB10_12355 [Ruminococcaceae bacterium]|jgi:hypothetical protein|nr:hypothetical protein [Oscillospiraceae bacterium]
MSDNKKPLPTSKLWEQLIKATSVKQFIGQNESEIGLPAFCEYISALCKERGEVPEHVIKKANIERSFGHAIFRGDRNPSRDTVLQLAFGFGADVELAQALLRHAGHSLLYPRVPRDTAIIYCLIHGTSIIETQHILMELNLPLIGGTIK